MNNPLDKKTPQELEDKVYRAEGDLNLYRYQFKEILPAKEYEKLMQARSILSGVQTYMELTRTKSKGGKG